MTAAIEAATWAAYLDHLARLKVPSAVSRLEGMPSRTAFIAQVKRDPVFAAQANALWKRRKLDDGVWERLLALLEHENFADACSAVGLSKATLTRKIKQDPSFGVRVEQLRLRPDLKHLRARASASTWDRVLELLATTPFDEVWSQPGVPARYSFFRRLKCDPEFAAQAAEAAGRRFKLFTIRKIDVDDEAIWERFLTALADTPLLDLFRQFDMPNRSHFYRKRSDDPVFEKRVAAILSQRFNSPYPPEQWQAFFAEIETASSSIGELCRRSGMPGAAGVQSRARRDPKFRAVLSEAIRRHRQKRIAARIKKRPVDTESFRAALSRDQLYAAVAAAVPKTLPPITRDDIICDMMLAVLEGDLDLDRLKVNVKEFVREHWRMFGTLRDVSLDATFSDDLSSTLGERLAGHGADYW